MKLVAALVTALLIVTPGAIAATPLEPSCRGLGSGTPFGTAECPGVRPGAKVRGSEDCTLNFLFRGSNDSLYIGTAGHCVLAAGGEITWDEGDAPPAYDSEGQQIGNFSYAIDDGPRDFALIRLLETVEADPTMCFFGGPKRVYRTQRTDPFVVHHFGHGAVVGSIPGQGTPVVPARSALARDGGDRWQVFLSGVATPGDSGSPVVTEDGEALGILIGVGAGDLYVSRLQPHLRRAAKALNIDLKLVPGT